ncbi:MAG TPA: MGMT family protein [Geobacteraceae bacterium]|nr:MGMT family protein [Geobacteraceae bacterium]
MTKVKSWREKLSDSKDLPKVVTLNDPAQKHWKGNTMAIPSPLEVNEIMAAVPKGKLITIQEIRKIIALKHRADIGCPLTCGIFSWISAHAAEEEAAEGKKNTTPYWRTLKTGGELNPKYPGGVEKQKRLLEAEGHKVIQKGKKTLVENFEMKLLKD